MSNWFEGFIISLVCVVFILVAGRLSRISTQNDIVSSCELSGHVVIGKKAYRCELID